MTVGSAVTPSRCPLCQGVRFTAYHFSLLRCAGCGLIVNPAIFQHGTGKALNEEAFGEEWEPERSFWVRWFQSWKNRRYLKTIQRYVQNGRLLEIGVGSGRFLEAARAAGFEVMGCDLSRPLAQRVEARTGVPVHRGDLATLPAQAFDVVCMHHVLEHVSDPVGFLRCARERLALGGVLHLAVPNGACWEARLPGWNCYVYYHLAYFDRATLRRTMDQAGFAVACIASHESFSTWFLTLARTAAGVRSMERPPQLAARPGRVPRWWPLVEHPYRLAMVASGAVTWPLRYVQGRLGYGDELIALARRSD